MGRRADSGKAQRELDYRPTSIADAVREAYQWFVAREAIKTPRQHQLVQPALDAGAEAGTR
jgi:hypothetical protein